MRYLTTLSYLSTLVLALAACVGLPTAHTQVPGVQMVIDPYTEQAATIEAPAELGDVLAWRELTMSTSIDIATKAFRQVAALPEATRRFAGSYQQALNSSQLPAETKALACYRLMLVPGWRYKSHPERGADLASIRDTAAAIGFDAAVIGTDEDDDVEDNAQLIAKRVRAAGPRPIILFSVSKGGAEVARALDTVLKRQSAPAVPVAAWINVNGLVGGTPLMDLLELRAAQRVVRALVPREGTRDAIQSMTTAARRTLAEPPWQAAGMLVVNFVAAPLTSEVSPAALPGFLTLSSWGPNDGITLLADAVVDHGITLTIPGTDHFLDLPDRNRRIGALLRATIAEIRSRGGAARFGCPAA
jgi:hypothetical protein